MVQYWSHTEAQCDKATYSQPAGTIPGKPNCIDYVGLVRSYMNHKTTAS